MAVDRSGASWVRVLGAVVAGAGIAATVGGTAGAGSLALTGLGALLVVVGFVLLGPVVARPVAGVVGGPLTLRRGMSGTLARRNAMRNPRRTAGTASALMVGVAVVTLFTVLAASVKQSIDDTVSSSSPAICDADGLQRRRAHPGSSLRSVGSPRSTWPPGWELRP